MGDSTIPNARVMKKLHRLSVVFIIVLAGCSLFFSRYDLELAKILVIKNVSSGTENTLRLPNDRFSIEYVHSVNKTRVVEEFRVDNDNRLALKAVRYSSLGVGMPYSPEEGTLAHENGEYILAGLNRVFQQIPLQVSPIPQYAVSVDGHSLHLSQTAGEGEIVCLTASDRWMLKVKERKVE